MDVSSGSSVVQTSGSLSLTMKRAKCGKNLLRESCNTTWSAWKEAGLRNDIVHLSSITRKPMKQQIAKLATVQITLTTHAKTNECELFPPKIQPASSR